jgi:hypothetical protein
MSPDELSGTVAKEANERAVRGLVRRRPDLRRSARGTLDVPAEERVQFQLDQLEYTAELVARLQEEMASLVVAAREEGASWAKVGVALRESAQTAFNRYRRFDPSPASGRPASRRKAARGHEMPATKRASKPRRQSV